MKFKIAGFVDAGVDELGNKNPNFLLLNKKARQKLGLCYSKSINFVKVIYPKDNERGWDYFHCRVAKIVRELKDKTDKVVMNHDTAKEFNLSQGQEIEIKKSSRTAYNRFLSKRCNRAVFKLVSNQIKRNKQGDSK